LKYFVPSEVRRSLLDLLWKQKLQGSVTHLSRLTGLSYSTVYEELRQMERVGLAQSLHHGREVEFKAKPDHPQAELLQKLLDVSQPTAAELSRQVEGEERVRSNLSRVGAPLGGKFAPREEMLLEETLFEGLKLARKDATVARVLPVALYLNLEKLNLGKLVELATFAGEKRTLGFYLELTGLLSNNSRLKKAAKELRDRRFKRAESFFVHQKRGEFQVRLEKRNTPKVAKHWRFTMNMGFDSFESHFRKFVP
jgi:hypothetical protein